MRKCRFFISILLMVISISASAQDVTRQDVDKQVDSYINQEYYDSASLVLIYFANQEYAMGNKEVALEYQKKNCDLIELHFNYFIQKGLTLKEYFDQYSTLFFLQSNLNQKEESIMTCLKLLEKVKRKLPQYLPYYAQIMAGSLADYTELPQADSIYCLQNALDVIKTQEVTLENVENYIWLCRCFNYNRLLIGRKNNKETESIINEIEKWHDNNRLYILNLDPREYKEKIIEYEIEYANLLHTFANVPDYIHAIEQYNKEINVLLPLAQIDSTLNQRISALYAQIGSCFFNIGNRSLCKQYCDKSFQYLLYHSEDLDYCTILSSLANSYFAINQKETSANIKKEEIRVREKLGEEITLTDWATYFLYRYESDPNEVIRLKDRIGYLQRNELFDVNYYLLVGETYSYMMNKNSIYRDSAESYFNKAESIMQFYKDSNDQYGLVDGIKRNICSEWAKHYYRLDEPLKSYECSLKSLQYSSTRDYYNYYEVALKSSLLHDTLGMHQYLPLYYYGMEDELCKMLPILGSVESDAYLGEGRTALYHIPEWVSWNKTDSICLGIAYDAALLMKGLTLRYNTLAPFVRNSSYKIQKINRLYEMRDSIFNITDENMRALALHKYEMEEREILKDVNSSLIRVHWKDLVKSLKNSDLCIEFVEYKTNSYLWNYDTIQKSHYAAIVLSNNFRVPTYVDLFDEDEVLEVYNLQPKSYDTEIGRRLFYKVWGKLQQYMDGKERVFFSPMGLLNLMNIELLTDSTGQTALQRFNLYRVSSTKNVLFPSNEHKPAYAVSFGDIDYDNAQTVLDSLNTRGNWSYLKNTQYEINRLKELFSENNISITANVGKGATEALFKALDGTNADIIHVASHGYYIPRGQRETIPYFANSESTKSVQDELFYSGLIMSGGQKAWTDSTFGVDRNDGILTAYEISKLDLHNVNLVVLSACETGLGDDLFDGIFGLQRAFKKAGAGSILMSLWKIDDKATSEFMGMFYEKLVKGYSKHEAYTNATHTMKEKYQDANYWASFILLD